MAGPCRGHVIPHRGAWLELEMEHNGFIATRIDRTRKISVTVLPARAGYDSDEKILKLYTEMRRSRPRCQGPVKERKGPKASRRR